MVLIRVFLFLSCSSIFLYQFIDLTRTYLQYKTNTRIRYDNEETEMPAFYLCLNNPFEKQQIFDYLGVNQLNMTTSKLYQKTLYEYLKREKQGFLKEMLEYPLLDEIEFFILIFEIQFKNTTRKSFDKLSLKWNNSRMSQEIFRVNRMIQLFDLRKCFSFFENHSNFVLWQSSPLTTYNIWIDHKKLNLDENNYYSLAIKDGREVPREEDLENFQTGSKYTVKMRMRVIERMEPPFDTMCKNYDKNIFKRIELSETEELNKELSYKQMNSRSKCLARCILEFNNPDIENSSIILFPESFYLTPSEWIRSGQRVHHNYDLYEMSVRRLKESEKRCRRLCPADCARNELSLSLSRGATETNRTHLHVKTPSYYVRISHHPDFTFLLYLGSVGGLAGVWLGITCYQISTEAVEMFATYFGRFWSKIQNFGSKQNRRNKVRPGTSGIVSGSG